MSARGFEDSMESFTNGSSSNMQRSDGLDHEEKTRAHSARRSSESEMANNLNSKAEQIRTLKDKDGPWENVPARDAQETYNKYRHRNRNSSGDVSSVQNTLYQRTKSIIKTGHESDSQSSRNNMKVKFQDENSKQQLSGERITKRGANDIKIQAKARTSNIS